MLKGVSSAKYIWRDIPKLAALNVGWAYGWSPYVPASTANLDSVPMVANAAQATSVVARDLRIGRIEGKYTELLGFNEPDNANQANLTPREAIGLWPLLESTGLKLGSPAPADATDGWLDQFMSLARHNHDRVDFIALHFYVDFTDSSSVESMMSTIRSVHDRYDLPVWVTEVGTVDIRPWGLTMRSAPSEAAAVAFMEATANAFSGLRGVLDRYAWFTDNCWATEQYRTSSLYDAEDELTRLGTAYSALK